jgi:hypothetical protein
VHLLKEEEKWSVENIFSKKNIRADDVILEML